MGCENKAVIFCEMSCIEHQDYQSWGTFIAIKLAQTHGTKIRS